MCYDKVQGRGCRLRVQEAEGRTMADMTRRSECGSCRAECAKQVRETRRWEDGTR